MANPLSFSGGQLEALPSGGIVIIHAPAATVSGWQDYYMTIDDFLGSLIVDVDALYDLYDLHTDEITELQNIGSLTKITSTTGAGSTAVTSNSILEWVAIKKISGTPSVKLGTTAGGDDIMGLELISDVTVMSLDKYLESGSSIHRTVSGGGTVNITYKRALSII